VANDGVCNAGAATRDVSSQPASPLQDCSDVIHISVFFDGTGNNKDSDETPQKWSNPARIWMAAEEFRRANANTNTYPIYISGVGTPFNGKALSAVDGMSIKVEDSDLAGMGVGTGGTRRLDFGQQQVNDALRSALFTRAKTLGGQVEKHADAGKQKSFADVNKALSQHRLIKQINVSIFGFSRGAALARAFCNQWLWDCEDNRGQLLYEGHPISFVFLGLFDTVASFGLPAANLSNTAMYGGFKGRDLVVDDRVERCVHFVAGHELRFCFPVDLIRRNGQLQGNWMEKVYPGVHSDVGGGYEPNAQDIDNNYARIPMRDMMREGLMQGTRLMGYENIRKVSFPLFQSRFECKPETEAAYKAYAAVCSPSGKVEHCMQSHMQQLYSAYGTLNRKGVDTVTVRQHKEGKSWALGPKDMAQELASYDQAVKNLKQPLSVTRTALDPTYVLRQGIYAMWISPMSWQVAAWKADASTGAMNFVHSFVHDSKVGFLANAEPFSYFSQRGIHESTHSVSGWIEANVTRPVDKAVEATVDYAAEKAEQAKKAAHDAAVAAQKKAKEAWDYAAQKAEQARQAAAEAAKSAGQSMGNATKQAVDALGSAWDKFGW
jgi:Uncharacterized alpha/beta hydrolase domain (DUF2235)